MRLQSNISGSCSPRTTLTRAGGSASHLTHMTVGWRPQFLPTRTSPQGSSQRGFPESVRRKRKNTWENANMCYLWLSCQDTLPLLPHSILYSSKPSPWGHEYQEAGIIGGHLRSWILRVFAQALPYDDLVANSLRFFNSLLWCIFSIGSSTPTTLVKMVTSPLFPYTIPILLTLINIIFQRHITSFTTIYRLLIYHVYCLLYVSTILFPQAPGGQGSLSILPTDVSQVPRKTSGI